MLTLCRLDDLSRSDLDPKKAFIRGALDKEIRLSFAKRIRSTVPTDYHFMIPESLERDKPAFKFESERMYSNQPRLAISNKIHLETPFSSQGKILYNQIRKRATEDEIQETLDVIQSQAEELGLTDVMTYSTDAFVTALCCIGAKSLSHVVSYIEKYKGRLSSIAQTSETLRRQILASVVEYWKDQPGVAVYIVDKLLNYSILTPTTVVQWALSDRVGAGEGLTENWVYEMISNTVGKVSRSVQNLLTAKFTPNLDPQVRAAADNAFPTEREAVRDLLKLIQQSVQPIADGVADKFLEKTGSGELSAHDATLLREWGKRWVAVFQRRALVEEMVFGDAALEAREKILAAEAALTSKAEAAEEATNGAVQTEANGHQDEDI